MSFSVIEANRLLDSMHTEQESWTECRDQDQLLPLY